MEEQTGGYRVSPIPSIGKGKKCGDDADRMINYTVKKVFQKIFKRHR